MSACIYYAGCGEPPRRCGYCKTHCLCGAPPTKAAVQNVAEVCRAPGYNGIHIEAVGNAPDGYDVETIEAVRRAGAMAGVAGWIMDMLPRGQEHTAAELARELRLAILGWDADQLATDAASHAAAAREALADEHEGRFVEAVTQLQLVADKLVALAVAW